MELVLTVLGSAAVVVGAAVFLGAALGLIRFPDPYTRISATGTAGGVGMILLVVGALLLAPSVANLVKAVLIVVLQLGTAAVAATGTAERIGALVADGTLDAELGEELVQSLHFLMGLRLKAGLAELEQEEPVTGRVDPQLLGSLERNLLKDALAVVKRFKLFLRLRLRLDAL